MPETFTIDFTSWTTEEKLELLSMMTENSRQSGPVKGQTIPCRTYVGRHLVKTGQGYNYIRFKDAEFNGRKLPGRYLSVHRLSTALRDGVLLNTHDVDHACKNTACFEPSHLTPYTRKRHAEEEKKRRAALGLEASKITRGELTDDQVREIVRRSDAGESSYQLGRAFGVHDTTIRNIMGGRSRSKVTGIVRKAKAA